MAAEIADGLQLKAHCHLAPADVGALLAPKRGVWLRRVLGGWRLREV